MRVPLLLDWLPGSFQFWFWFWIWFLNLIFLIIWSWLYENATLTRSTPRLLMKIVYWWKLSFYESFLLMKVFFMRVPLLLDWLPGSFQGFQLYWTGDKMLVSSRADISSLFQPFCYTFWIFFRDIFFWGFFFFTLFARFWGIFFL